jgi:tRNA A-37 threonylcarbamoyl transferase component Bud32
VVDPLVSPADPGTVDASGRFEMLGRIGAGNHGVVFRARDRHLGREVAVKRFSHFLADDPRAMRRITREVEALARVSHPHVVTVHDLVHMPDGDGEVTPHLVMELVEGTSLRELLLSHGPSPRATVAVRGVLDGLAACHRAGILHLDIKPANVLVTPEGGVKIVDFGISRAASDTTATVAGTPHYMAPEQYDGRADERSDVYSVGCLLHECLTGRPPFEGSVAEQLLAHRQAPRPDLHRLVPGIAPELAAVVTRAMAVDPDERFAGVEQMSAALDAAEGASGTRTVEVPPAVVPRPLATESAWPDVEEPDGLVGWPERLRHWAVGALLALGVALLVPTLAAGSDQLVPAEHAGRAATLVPSLDWGAIALLLVLGGLALRGRALLPALAGPAVGEAVPRSVVTRWHARAVRLTWAAAWRGSLVLLLPWYAAGVSWLVTRLGLDFPEGSADAWRYAWAVMPAVSVLLAWWGVTRLRPRFGSLLVSMLRLTAAAAAAGLFVAYPVALG